MKGKRCPFHPRNLEDGCKHCQDNLERYKMPLLLDTRINRFVKLLMPEVEAVNKCRELMLQAQTYAYEGKNVDSHFALARVERDRFPAHTPPWNLCENAIQRASVTIMLLQVGE